LLTFLDLPKTYAAAFSGAGGMASASESVAAGASQPEQPVAARQPQPRLGSIDFSLASKPGREQQASAVASSASGAASSAQHLLARRSVISFGVLPQHDLGASPQHERRRSCASALLAPKERAIAIIIAKVAVPTAKDRFIRFS
jgi:hypothetical protein